MSDRALDGLANAPPRAGGLLLHKNTPRKKKKAEERLPFEGEEAAGDDDDDGNNNALDAISDAISHASATTHHTQNSNRSHHSAFLTAIHEHEQAVAKLRKETREKLHAASVPTFEDESHAIKLAQLRLAKSRHAMRGHRKEGHRDDSHKVNAMEAIARKSRDVGQVALRCNMRKFIDFCGAGRCVDIRATGSIFCAAFDLDITFHVEGLMRGYRIWNRQMRKDRLHNKANHVRRTNESALRKYRAISQGLDPFAEDSAEEDDDDEDDDEEDDDEGSSSEPGSQEEGSSSDASSSRPGRLRRGRRPRRAHLARRRRRRRRRRRHPELGLLGGKREVHLCLPFEGASPPVSSRPRARRTRRSRRRSPRAARGRTS